MCMKKFDIKVKGMMCAGCENRVKNALNLLEGVQTVEANHIDGVVKINTNDTVKIEEIKQKIEDLGFEVVKED